MTVAFSRSLQAKSDLERAEEHLENERRRVEGLDGLWFASVKHALRFYFERAPAMQGALGHHPRGQLGPDGQLHYIQVDGGRGGSLDDVLATLQTIHDAMEDLRVEYPNEHLCVVLYRRDELSQREISDKVGRSQCQVSAGLGRAEAYLAGALRHARILARAAA